MFFGTDTYSNPRFRERILDTQKAGYKNSELSVYSEQKNHDHVRRIET